MKYGVRRAKCYICDLSKRDMEARFERGCLNCDWG